MDLPTQVPLFPLPNQVLLIGVPVLYRVFEPRYRALVDDLLGLSDPADRWLAIPGLAEGWQSDYYGNPPILTCAAVARVRSIRPSSHGEFEIIVEGLARCDLHEVPSAQPYRLARPTPRPDEPVDDTEVAHHLDDLLGHVGVLLRSLGDRAQRLAQVINENAPPEDLVDCLGAVMLGDHQRRQYFLEQRNLIARIDLLRDMLHQALGKGPGMAPSHN